MHCAPPDPERGVAVVRTAVVVIALLGAVVAGSVLFAPAAAADVAVVENDSTASVDAGLEATGDDGTDADLDVTADASLESDPATSPDGDGQNATGSDADSATREASDPTAHDGETVDIETSVDGETAVLDASDDAEAEGEPALDADATAALDGANASVAADADVDTGVENETLDTRVESELGGGLAVDATLAANASGVLDREQLREPGNASAPAAGSPDAGAADAGARDGDPGASEETDRDDGDDRDRGDGDGVPMPDRRTGGVAIGAVLAGAGLAARRAGTVAVASGGAGSSTVTTLLETLRTWGWRLLGLFGYQRYDDTDPLAHETRAAIYEHVRSSPGTYLTEIGEATSVPLSTVRYHVRILAFENLLTEVSVRGKRRFVPADVDPDALRPALEEDGAAAVLEALAEQPDSVSDLAERIDRDPSTVTHHLQRLEESGLVERERQGRSVINRLADEFEGATFDGEGRSASAAD